MEQFFTSLSKRQTMMLLTAIAFGGSESVGSFEHLPREEEELLKYRGEKLLQIPRDKRVPLLVQEIKRLITQRRRQLASAEPKRLAAVLKNERPAMVEVVLRALPSDLADATRAALGGVPSVKLSREPQADVLSIIRWKLEEALNQNAPQVGAFRFTDLLTLQQRELLAILDRMGVRVLATAIAGLPEAERDAWLGRLPPDQRSLAARAAEAGKSRHLNDADAKTVLEIYGALDAPSQGIRNAGAQRLIRACVAQGADFVQRMVERHPGDLGRTLARWVKEEKGRSVKGDGGRQDIVEQMERLAQKGVIDKPLRLPSPLRPPTSPQQSPPPRRETGKPSTSRAGLPPVSGAPEAGRPSGQVPRRPSGALPGAKARELAKDRPRRDPIAERNARRAGAVSGRGAPGAVPAASTGKARGTNAEAKSKRILRDGKLLADDPNETQPPKRRSASASPALQAIPKRKQTETSGRAAAKTQFRSPVLKGSGSGRGPRGGSE